MATYVPEGIPLTGAPTVVTTSSRSSGSVFIWIIVIIVVLLIIGLVIWWVVRRNNALTSGTATGTTTTSSTWIWAIGGFLLLILIIGGLFYAFRDDDEEKKVIAAPPPPATTVISDGNGGLVEVIRPPPVMGLIPQTPIVRKLPPPVPLCPPVPACPAGTVYRPPAVTPAVRLQEAELIGEAAILAELRNTNRELRQLAASVNSPCQMNAAVQDGQRLAQRTRTTVTEDAAGDVEERTTTRTVARPGAFGMNRVPPVRSSTVTTTTDRTAPVPA